MRGVLMIVVSEVFCLLRRAFSCQSPATVLQRDDIAAASARLQKHSTSRHILRGLIGGKDLRSRLTGNTWSEQVIIWPQNVPSSAIDVATCMSPHGTTNGSLKRSIRAQTRMTTLTIRAYTRPRHF